MRSAFVRFASLGAVAALGSTLIACDDENLVAVQPDLRIPLNQLDFGTAELGQDAYRVTALRSNSSVDVDIEAIRIEDDCEGCFLAVEVPDLVEAGRTFDLELKFRAKKVGVATATVTVVSNDPDDPEIPVFLIGRGIDTRKPDIEVVPGQVDFGFSPAGGIALSSFVVRSTGTNDLLIDRIRVEPEDAPFRITTSTPTPERPGSLAPGEQASVSLRAELPEGVTGTVTASIFIETNVVEDKNVPGRPGWVEVPLRTVANLPPVAVVNDALTVEPWSRVTLDGASSFDQDDPPDEPLTYKWRMVSSPPGSTTELERTREAQSSFWADLTGIYEVELIVTDALGLESEPAIVVVEALPPNAVRIELTWDHPDSDLDLHLIRDGGQFCDCANDVHYRECGRTPDWFPQTPGANPRLDIDDRAGFGPENINIDGHGTARFIPDGAYTIAVHYFSTNEQVSSWPTTVTNATVRVFVFGLLAAELNQEMTLGGDVWVAGTLRWPDQVVTPDGAYFEGETCGTF